MSVASRGDAKLLSAVFAVIFLAIACSARVQFELNVEDSCTLSNGETGACKNFNECPGAVEAVRAGNLPPICSFEGVVPIICCSLHSKRISERKCQTYLGYAEEESRTTTTTTTTSPFLASHFPQGSTNACELPNNGLVVGGVNASLGEFPHMAAVGYKPADTVMWNCGGSLISERFVLTAAHCLHTQDGPARFVRLGEHDISTDDDGANPVDYQIETRYAHPEYRPQWNRYNDIGLLKLDRDVLFTHYIRPACLSSQPIAGNRASAIGWGRTVHFDGPRATVLQKVGLNLVSNDDCNQEFLQLPATQFNAIIPRGIIPKIICAGNTPGKDTCPGDSGGPLQQKENSFCSYTVIGITSFGFLCGYGKPAVYTRVSSYLDWIEKTVWPEYIRH